MSKPKTFVLHDESVNTYGFRMLTDGADLTEFNKNPVMFYWHGDTQLPIGRWENIRKEDGKILADAVFDVEDKFALEVKGKVDRDFIRMASIGTWPPEEYTDADESKLPGQTGPTITKWKAREASIVPIGGNHNALRLYDNTGKLMDLGEPNALIRLFDNHKTNPQNDNKMKRLLTVLGLADSASEDAAVTAVQTVLSDNKKLKDENESLNKKLSDQAAEKKEAEKKEAVKLIDAAVTDGRIDAKGKEKFIELFDKDFSTAKAALEAIPQRATLGDVLKGAQNSNMQEAEYFQKTSWSELDKANKLTQLKDKFPDLYASKFEAEFGTKPKS